MYPGKDDATLVAGALRGDKRAFAALVDRHDARVRSVTQRLLGTREDAEDLAQEAVLQAYLGLGTLREPARFGSWLCGIAVNLAKMRLRQRESVPLALEQLEAAASAEAGRLARAPAASPEQALEGSERLDLVQEALAVLPLQQREAVVLHDVHGFSSNEIGAMVGETAGAVRVRLHRGRRQLRRRLTALGPRSRKEKLMIEAELRDVLARVLADEHEGGEPRLAAPQRIVLLQEKNGERMLPIWVGAPDGDALALHLGGEKVPRPLTADLMARLLEATGGRVERVAVSSLVEKTFYAVVRVIVDARAEEVDARPSDAINLAVRVEAPIFVDEEVLASEALTAGDRAQLERELTRRFEEFGGEQPPGEWRSLSPELIKERLWPPSPGQP